MPSIEFKPLRSGELPQINDIDAAHELMVMTPDGPRAILKDDAAAALGGGGGGGGGVDIWDPQNTMATIPTSVKPFTHLWYAAGGLQELMSVPTLSTVGGLPKITKTPQNADSNMLASFYLEGSLPQEPFAFWMQMTFDLTSAQTYYGIVVGDTYWQMPTVPQLGVITIQVTAAGITMTARNQPPVTLNIANPTAATKVMFGFDGSFATVTAYVDNGGVVESAQQYAAGQFNSQMMACNIFTQEEGATASVIVNLTDESELIAPAGSFAGPLTFRAAPLPAGATVGHVLKAVSYGFYLNRKIIGGESYYLGEDDIMVPFVKTDDFVRLDTRNQFAEPQIIQNTAIDIRGSNYWFNSALSPGYTKFVDGLLTGVYLGPCFNSIDSGTSNVGIGSVYTSLPVSYNNIGIGQGSGATLKGSSQDNVLIGNNTLASNVAASVVAVGHNAINISGYTLLNVTAIGPGVMANHSDPLTPDSNETSNLTQAKDLIAIGGNAMTGGVLGDATIAIGNTALTGTPTEVIDCVAIGHEAMNQVTGQHTANTAVGHRALRLSGPVSQYNTAIGKEAGSEIEGSNNVYVGYQAGMQMPSGGSNNTAVGSTALRMVSSAVSNVTALGYQATVTADNQVQLGNSSTTVYAYGAVQDRSDPRDKTDKRPTLLGLDFVLKCVPMDYRLDLRDDYVDHAGRPEAPAPLREKPGEPDVKVTDENYHEIHDAYAGDLVSWEDEVEAHRLASEEYRRLLAEWAERNRLGNIVTDGSKKRVRFHHGFMAPQVLQAAKECGAEDFGGFQDHAVNGGEDVHSLGYTEMIAPAYRAIQELYEMMTSDEFVSTIAQRVADRLNQNPSQD